MSTTRHERYQRFTAVTAILAAPFSYLLMFTLLHSLSFDLSILGTPEEFIAIGTEGAMVFKWTMVLDIFGQYLFLLPLVVFLWYWLRPKDSLLVGLVSITGVAYILLGALGVAINAAVFPELIVQYAEAGTQEQATLETVFGTFATAIIVGSWGIFVRILGGIYWLGIGWFLTSERRNVGYFSIILGIIAIISAVGNMVQIDPLIGAGTLGYLLGFPAWALWLGLVLYRNPAITPATAGPTTNGE